jgi:hypothetical protein
VIDPPLLRGRARYERAMHGWVDSIHAEAFTHTVRLREPDREIELTLVALPSPTYVIREARCQALAGALAPDVIRGVAALVDVSMVGGLTRRAAELVGEGDGARLVVDAVVEGARLARQVTRLPAERAARAAGGDALAYWQLDMAGWVDLPNSCFTYSPEGRRRFEGRNVVSPATPDLYSPGLGQRRVFERRKHGRLERADGQLALFQSMHDNVHGFEIGYRIDLATGRVVSAESRTPKLPYLGICSEPQARIQTLVGECVDAGLRKRLSALVGGSSGCAQLFDLTSDLLKLLS